MNNLPNYSQLSELLVFEYSKRKELLKSEILPDENILTIEDAYKDLLYLVPEVDKRE